MDVTVRGAGIFGLSIAWACVQRGARVQVIDPNGPGAGASGGIVGALAPHVPENWNTKKAFQFDSLIKARTFWPDVEAAGGIPSGYVRSGRVQPINDAKALALAHARAETARDLWQGLAQWMVRPITNDAHWTPPSQTGFVIHDTLSAQLHPRQACAALAAALRAGGARITTQAPDQGQVVWATGVAGLDALSRDLGRPSDQTPNVQIGNGVKGQAALLRHDAGGAAQLFIDGMHFVPHGDGTVAIGSTSERSYESPHQTDALLDELLDRAFAALPVLRDSRVIERWAGLRPRTKSRAPMIGPHPVRSGQFIANGGFKIGFGMAPGVAEAMANLILDGRDTIPAEFRVDASL